MKHLARGAIAASIAALTLAFGVAAGAPPLRAQAALGEQLRQDVLPHVDAGKHSAYADLLDAARRRTDVAAGQTHVFASIDSNHAEPELREVYLDPAFLARAKAANFGAIALEGGSEMNTVLQTFATSRGTTADIQVYLKAFQDARLKAIKEAGLEGQVDDDFKTLNARTKQMLLYNAAIAMEAHKQGIPVKLIDRQPPEERIKLLHALAKFQKIGLAEDETNIVNLWNERQTTYDPLNAADLKAFGAQNKTNVMGYFGFLHFSPNMVNNQDAGFDIDDHLRQLGVAVTMISNVKTEDPKGALDTELASASQNNDAAQGPITRLHAVYSVTNGTYAVYDASGLPEVRPAGAGAKIIAPAPDLPGQKR